MRLMGSARAAAPRVPCLAAFGIGGSSWPVPPASRWGRHAELTGLLTVRFALPLRVQLQPSQDIVHGLLTEWIETDAHAAPRLEVTGTPDAQGVGRGTAHAQSARTFSVPETGSEGTAMSTPHMKGRQRAWNVHVDHA